MWIFGYGSLMGDGWEEKFGCVRRSTAELHGYRRTFSKVSKRNKGSKAVPCPTLNLEKVDDGVCKGIAFNPTDVQGTRGVLHGDQRAISIVPIFVPTLQTDGHTYAQPATSDECG